VSGFSFQYPGTGQYRSESSSPPRRSGTAWTSSMPWSNWLFSASWLVGWMRQRLNQSAEKRTGSNRTLLLIFRASYSCRMLPVDAGT